MGGGRDGEKWIDLGDDLIQFPEGLHMTMKEKEKKIRVTSKVWI